MKNLIIKFLWVIGFVVFNQLSATAQKTLPQPPFTTYNVYSGQNKTVTDNVSITLKPGVHIRAGANFHANLYPVIPSPPSSLVATAISSREIRLTWVDKSVYEAGFIIYSSDSEEGVFIPLPGHFGRGPNVTTFINTGLPAKTTYFYKVKAYGSGGHSEFSNLASATTDDFPAPSGLAASLPAIAQIKLEWKDNSSYENGFQIERSTDEGISFSPLITTNANMTSYTETGLNPNTTYKYRVRTLFGSETYSKYSNEVSATTINFQAPSDLMATATVIGEINLTWSDNTNAVNEAGFQIERKANSCSWCEFVPLTTTAANVSSFTDTGLEEYKAYSYRVKAIHSSLGSSYYSNVASERTLPDPVDPIDPLVYQALVDFYNSTDGDNWVRNDNWVKGGNSLKRIQSWYGVEINNFGNLYKIHLPHNNLNGELPATIGNLGTLAWINWSGNHLNGEIPATIGDLAQLHVLGLSNNSLSGEIPSSIANSTNLGSIGLSLNYFTSFPDLKGAPNAFTITVWINQNCIPQSDIDVNFIDGEPVFHNFFYTDQSHCDNDGGRIASKGILSTEDDIENNEEGTELIVYPNPSNGVLAIQSSLLRSDAQVKIVDNLNRNVRYQVLQKDRNKIIIDIDGSTGVYFIRIYTEDSVATKKVVIN